MRKYIIPAVCLIALNLSLNAQQLPSYVATNGLIGWWPFNGNANDESGNLHNGMVIGASLTSDRSGNSNAAYNFNGISNAITCGNVMNVSSQNAITISGWYCPSLLVATQNEYAGIDIGQKPLNHLTLRVVNIALQKFQCMHGKPSGPGAHYVGVMSDADFVPNQWYHVVGIYKNNAAHLFVNGVEQTYLSNFGNTLNTIPAQSELYFGKSYVDNYVENFYKGKLDDIGVWNRELTSCEIMQLYLGSNSPALIVSPSIAHVTSGSSVQFSAQLTSAGAVLQWQSNPLNMGWQNVSNNLNYQGSQTSNLTVNNVQISNHYQAFRIVSSFGLCRDTSNTALIYIDDTCRNTITDTNYVTVLDTNYSTVSDTIFVTVTDTLFISIGNCHGNGHGHGHGHGHGNGHGSEPGHGNGNGHGHRGSIVVYPNPTHDFINIDYSDYSEMSGCVLQIEDAYGRSVYKSSVQKTFAQIDIRNWAENGIYYVRLMDANQNTLEVRKIILK